MDIMLKGNNGEKVVIPIEDLIQKYWSDENSKPNRIEMSATVKDETILAAMTICDEKEENYLSVDLESRNEKFDTEALWCSLEAPNTLNPFVTGYLYSGNSETESDEWLVRIGDGYRAADDDSPRLIFVNEEAVSIQDSRGEFEGENKYKWFAATEKQFDKPFSYVNFGTRLEEATHGCVKRIQSMIVSKDEATVNRIADMLDSMGFDAVTGYFDPKEDERSGEVDSLTGYYYVCI